MNSYEEILNFRYACKIFDENRKILDSDFEKILNSGRLSPSSFGMQHWKFLLIESLELKKVLKELCWNQHQITTCSHLVLILAKKTDVLANSDYVVKEFKKRGLTKELEEAYLEKYANFIDNITKTIGIFSWSSKQCYIALTNMLNQAAFLKIDSCPIEGFEKEKIEELLNIDTKMYELSVIATFGYAKNSPTQKNRFNLDEIVEYIKD